MANVFNRTIPGKTPRSVQNLSHMKAFTADGGWLYPALTLDVVPGDIIDYSAQIVARCLPLVAPIMSPLRCSMHVWNVPYRLVHDVDDFSDASSFEDMIIGGADGDTEYAVPEIATGVTKTKGSLWDHFGFPIDIAVPVGDLPVAYLWRGYNRIWNTFYRDQELVAEVNESTNYGLLPVSWQKDFYTTARDAPQRGTAAGMPLSISTSDTDIYFKNATDATDRTFQTYNQGTNYNRTGLATQPSADNNARFGTQVGLQINTVDVHDIRLMFAEQRFMEVTMRSGARYMEFLYGHFGPTGFSDARLQRPQYIGGVKFNIVTSEVLATTEDSGESQSLGQMAGHGVGIANKRLFRYRVPEYGMIMGLLSIMPEPIYSQGIDRQWKKSTMWDFYFPEFAYLGEQEVLYQEILATTVTGTNNTVFGYQGRYNHMRTHKNMVCGDFAYNQSLNYWTQAREFASAIALDSDFISGGASGNDGGFRDDVFSVTTGDKFMVQCGHMIKAIRPIPAVPVPGGLR